VSGPLRIGIVGARGIGRHQAKWFAQLGCEVAAIYGTTRESAAEAAEGVRQLFDFQGRVEWDWEQFVRAPDIQAASVCSPAEAHAANTLALLHAGKHVLCEKPLVWDWESSPDAMRSAARQMIETARATGRVLAVNAQYPAAVPPLLQLYRTANNREPEFKRVVFHMETAGAPRSSHGSAEVWADLGPHPLAFMDRLLEGGAPDLGSARCQAGAVDAAIHLDWIRAGRRVPVSFDLRRIKDKAAIRREFGLDGWTAAYHGRTVDGEFKAALVAGPHEWVGEDFMRASIRTFVEAARAGDPSRALLMGEDALRQFEHQIMLWECFFR
jgi:predicted dehydrogenase